MQKFLVFFLFIFLSACQSTHPNDSPYQADLAMNDLTEYALSLTGTPYRYGGTSPDSGFDCSGFVGHVFKHSLDKSLPRSSDEISHVGVAEQAGMLRPGDLVFYNTLHKTNSHVGIYLGDGQFVHSPGRGKAVSVANMNETYWRKRYNGARRIRP
jgi:cell wall-associated NlpC family hydrolase